MYCFKSKFPFQVGQSHKKFILINSIQYFYIAIKEAKSTGRPPII